MIIFLAIVILAGLASYFGFSADSRKYEGWKKPSDVNYVAPRVE
jgi:hypothetical protein